MNTAWAKSWKAISLLVFLLALPGWAAAQTKFKGIVIIGTSLSDPGNVFELTGMQSTPP